MGLQGGIGSASRIVTVGGQHFTLGALVQTNFGRLDDLLVAGYPAGAAIRRIVSAPPAPEDKGSCMIIIGTDLPVSHRQLSRILRRAAVGLVRTGSFVGHGSGDVVLGFTTANRLCREQDDLRQVTLLREEALDGAFRAAAESVEEATLNSLCTADRVTATGMGAAGNETVTLAGFWNFCLLCSPLCAGADDRSCAGRETSKKPEQEKAKARLHPCGLSRFSVCACWYVWLRCPVRLCVPPTPARPERRRKRSPADCCRTDCAIAGRRLICAPLACPAKRWGACSRR